MQFFQSFPLAESTLNTLAAVGSFLASFGLAWGIIPAIIKLVREKNLYAEPNERTSHTYKTPTLGGIAVFLSIMVAIPLFAYQAQWQQVRFLIVALVIIFTIGVKDDILVISPMKKMLGQLLASGALVLGTDVRITHLHGFFGIFQIDWLWSVLLSLFVFVTVINAVNFIDGIDGLAAGAGILNSLVFGTWFLLTGHQCLSVVGFSLAGALGAFFYFNVYSKDYKIFMGDTGSLLLGLLLAAMAIAFNEYNITKAHRWAVESTPSVTFAIMVLPLFDLLRIIYVRRVLNKPLSSPDRLHLHHRVLRLGFSHRQATYWMLAFNVAFVVFGFAFQYISIRRLLLLELVLAMLLSYLPTYLYDRRLKKTTP